MFEGKAKRKKEKKMDTLKSCPHCGGDACLHSNYSYKARSYFVYAKCDVCGAQGKIYRSKTDPVADDWQSVPCMDAVAAWNMRTYKDE